MKLSTLYLALYNAASMAGWAYVIYLIGQHFNAGGDPSQLYGAIEQPLKIVQTTALLEIVHSLLGLVRSPVATTAIQGEWGHVIPIMTKPFVNVHAMKHAMILSNERLQ